MWRSAVQLREGLQLNLRGYSSVGRAPALQAGGQEFESLYLHSISHRKCGGFFRGDKSHFLGADPLKYPVAPGLSPSDRPPGSPAGSDLDRSTIFRFQEVLKYNDWEKCKQKSAVEGGFCKKDGDYRQLFYTFGFQRPIYV